MAETLAQSLRTTTPPANPTAALLRGDTIQARGKAALKELPSLLESGVQAAGEQKAAELKSQSDIAQREAETLTGGATQLRQETQRIRAQEQPYQEFKAPEYTAADYAKGAAMRALTAVMLGGVAKTSALTQLKAIKAMQDAEKEGRQNDFLNAQLTFNEAEKKRVDFNERLKRDLDDFEKLLNTDTKAALAQAKVIDARTQGSLVQAFMRAQRYKEAIPLARDNMNLLQDLEKQREIETLKGEYRLAEERIKAEGKAKKDDEPSKAERDQIVARASLQERIPKLIEIIEKNKDKLGLKTLLGEQFISRLDKEGIELRSGLAQINADYRFSKGGKALTKNENEILQGVSDWRGKEADAIIRQLKALQNYVETDQNIYQRLYPSYMSRLGGRKSFANEEEADIAYREGKIEINEPIIINGRKAFYVSDNP
jgi:hypothetical protein